MSARTRQALAALSTIAFAVSQSGAAHAAGPGQVDLNLWPAGQGRIAVAQDGSAVGSCEFVDVVRSAKPCVISVTAGTPVTLAAVPEPAAQIPDDLQSALPDLPAPDPAFVHWSRYECGGGEACTFTPDADGDWITAVFTPLQLQVGINGAGSVSVLRADGGLDGLACGGGGGFGENTCHGRFAADADVVLVAQPDNAGDAIHWGPDCRLDPCDPSGSRCIVTVDNIRTLAAVAFGDEGVPDAGFLIMPRIRVVRAGSGDGSVSGTGIDCGTACAIQPRYQSRVDLEASAAAGSSFVRWEGVCSTIPTCAFAAGSATVVRALFERDPAAPWNPRVLKTSVRGHRSRRAITLVVAVDRPAGARVRLFRGRRTATARTFALAPGSNTLRLRVPRSAKRGSYRLSVIVFAGADSTTTKRTVRVPR